MRQSLVCTALLGCALACALPAKAEVHWVDCGAGQAGSGTSAAPWHSLDQVNAHIFVPGDEVRFRRNTSCFGSLQPNGSGAPGAPIRISAYGAGARPKILPVSGTEYGLHLANQQGWEIADLDIHGGTKYGVLITADSGLMQHIELSNLEVHDAAGVAEAKASGLIVIRALQKGSGFADVTLDGVLAHNTAQWSGIYVSGQDGPVTTSDVTVRNSIVHDVGGDGIVLFGLQNGRIEHSIAYRTGLSESDKAGTPNAIWTWRCNKCMVQDNEAFLTDSPGIDGGAFDVDWANTGNIVRRNYAHDTQGYCVAIFAAFGETRDSEVSNNLCIANGLSPRLALRQGAVFLMTWQKGVVRGASIHDNRIYWDPPCACPAIRAGPDWDALGISFTHNFIASTVSKFASPTLALDFTNTLDYIHSGSSQHDLSLRGSFFCPARNPTFSGTLTLSLPQTQSVQATAALLVLLSEAMQYRPLGLRAELHVNASPAEIAQLRADWHLDSLGVTVAQQKASSMALELTFANARPQHWSPPFDFRGVGFALRQAFGAPVFSTLP